MCGRRLRVAYRLLLVYNISMTDTNRREDNSKNNLNTEQERAANTISGPLLILAGAGAGKTKTITERAVNIIKSGIEPDAILCITFTNKAAAEMRERILNRLKEEKINSHRNPTIKTFHSLGVMILREQYIYAGLHKSFTILDSDDSRKIVKEIIDRLGLDPKHYDASKIKNIISSEKNKGHTVSDYLSTVGNYTMEIVANVWREYNAEVRRQQAVDFDDLIIRPMELLRDNEAVRNFYQKRYTHIQVDEYQDTNNTQYQLTRLLVGEGNNICAVGDMDQNIYSWRGANLRNILNFEKDYKGATMILLEENYRSTQNILTLANRSIAKNKARAEKNLFTRSSDGDMIEVLPAWDEYSESSWIAATCKRLIDSGVLPSDIAILYRANFQSRIHEESMLKANIPYQLVGTRFYERREIKDVLSYLRVAINRDSLVNLRRVFECPRRGIGPSTIAKVFAHEQLPITILKKINPTYVLLDKIVQMLETESLSSTLTWLIIESGIEKSLKDDGAEGLERLENVYELVSITVRYDHLNGLEALELFLEESGLHSDQDDIKSDNKESTETKSGVRLMTIHASKGLEFEYVFITGLEQDLFPHIDLGGRNKTAEEKEEERRLFYVAVTRAKKKLYLSYAEARTIFGKKSISIPSEFLADTDEDIAIYHDMYYEKRGEEEVEWD